MQFPSPPKGTTTKQARAAWRLRYLIHLKAMQHTGRGSVRALAGFVGYEHTTLALYVKRGAFSEKCAAIIAPKIGVQQSWLTDPLSIPTT